MWTHFGVWSVPQLPWELQNKNVYVVVTVGVNVCSIYIVCRLGFEKCVSNHTARERERES